MKHCSVYVRGAGDKDQSGPYAAGVYIVIPDTDPHKEVAKFGLYLGADGTLDKADYMAARAGLRHAMWMGYEQVVLCTDSEILIDNLLAPKNCKQADLKKLLRDILLHVAPKFKKFTVKRVRRDENWMADWLAQGSLDRSYT
jgi:ribonuclease HI